MEQEPEKKMAKKKKTWLGELKKIWNHPRGKSILFFLGYLIFFFFLIMGLRSKAAENREAVQNHLSNNITANYKLDGISDGNYYFSRTETLNGITSIFEGRSNANRSEVVMARNNELYTYFMYGGIVIQKMQEAYQVATQPYLYPNLSVYKYIHSILNQATLLSKTAYSTGNTVYNYEISTTTLVQILDSKVIDIDDLPNQIEVEVGESQNVVGITYHLNAYASYMLQVPTTLTIALEYRDFGQVETLEIPES